MRSKKVTYQGKVGVIGAGSFGTAIANLLAYNVDVLLFSRNPVLVEKINKEHHHLEVKLSSRIRATNHLQELAKECALIFIIVPSDAFREVTMMLTPHLRPYHIIIHGTKGFDVSIPESEWDKVRLSRKHVTTMSEIITELSPVVRVGCLSGPNLAVEIMEGQPTATVIGSRFDEVIKLGKTVLSSKYFNAFGNYDITGAEMAGALKNVIAIGSGVLKGIGMGKNIQAMLITRGWVEMIHFGKKMGSNSKAFFGTAGIADLVATATSSKSRNYSFGHRLGKGEKLEDIIATMPELAEGVRTLKITQNLSTTYKMHTPITNMLYSVVFEDFEVQRALEYLMRYPYDVDVDFL